ncbi:MAG: hypothetical protein LUO89_07395 [Methanothrix sp.]|nr:hypothetical protein [Methanothrix sp.]
MKQAETPEVVKFDDIVSELGRRGVTVLMHRPTRWGYVVDAVIPSAKIVILKMPDLTKQVKVAMSQFRDLINRLESDGYQIMVVPKNRMNEAQVKAFCDRIAAEPTLAAA